MNRFIYLLLTVAAIVLAGCREDDVIYIPETVEVARPTYTSVQGMYVLNEGNMGSNKATIDYMDFYTGKYSSNLYGAANPTIAMGLGDVGNDIAIYGNRLYVVVNGSNKVEVMNKHTLKRLGQIDIPNCRFIAFHDGQAYVTSSASTSQEQRGYVARVDTATMQVGATCIVGYQPSGLEIADGKIYVVNSGGYMTPYYENTLSVIDIATFKEVEHIPVAINLLSVRIDKRGLLWIVSQGDFYEEPSNIHVWDTRKHRMVKTMDITASSTWIDGDSLYVASAQWNYVTMGYELSFAIINTATLEIVSRNFITDGSDAALQVPYGIAVNPITKDIYIADARDYVSPGRLYCYGQDGRLKWDVRTGDIPGHFAFVGATINK